MAKKTKYIKLVNGEIVLRKAIMRITKGTANGKPSARVYYNNAHDYTILQFDTETAYEAEISRLCRILGVS